MGNSQRVVFCIALAGVSFLAGAVLVAALRRSPASALPIQPPIPVKDATMQVFFSPNGGAQEAIVAAIANAKTSVLVQAYSFSALPIAQALIDAHKRGVRVEILLDPTHAEEKKSLDSLVVRAGIPTKVDPEHAKAHNKLMIIDEEIVITGSYNFIPSAEAHNAENLLVITSKELAAAYLRNWNAHAAHSQPLR
jgi:phosphatidylserine/phosphatidylglycerophosphate/cardiolipin synthase-like enzyme